MGDSLSYLDNLLPIYKHQQGVVFNVNTHKQGDVFICK